MGISLRSAAAGRPALFQGRYGSRGNLELVTPAPDGGLVCCWFNSDPPAGPVTEPSVPAATWSDGLRFAGGTAYLAVAGLQTRRGPDWLEVVATHAGGLHRWTWSPGPGFELTHERAGVTGLPVRHRDRRRRRRGHHERGCARAARGRRPGRRCRRRGVVPLAHGRRAAPRGRAPPRRASDPRAHQPPVGSRCTMVLLNRYRYPAGTSAWSWNALRPYACHAATRTRAPLAGDLVHPLLRPDHLALELRSARTVSKPSWVAVCGKNVTPGEVLELLPLIAMRSPRRSSSTR